MGKGETKDWRDLKEEMLASIEALRRENRFLRAVIDSLPIPIYAKDLKARKILTNPADMALMGVSSAEEALGKTDEEIYPTASASRSVAEDRKVLETGQPIVDEEFFGADAQGNPHWFLVSKVPLFDEEGRVIGIAGFAQDITERKRMEEALRESEARYRRLAENAVDLVYRYEFVPKRGFTYVNSAATAITGYTPEEHYADLDLGFKIVHPEDRPLLEATAQGKFEPGKPLVFRWVRKDGQIIWAEQRNVPIYDEAGNLVAIEGIARDITERKRMEEALRESEARYRRIVEMANEGIWQDDADSRVVYVNRRMAEMLGYTPEEMLGRTSEEFVFPEDLEEYRLMEGRRRQGMADVYQRRLRTKDGGFIHALVSAVPLFSEEGVYLGSFAMITDITERVEAEQALARERRLLRTVLDGLPVAVYAKDLEGRKILTNKADLEFGGFSSPEEVLGKTDAEIYPPELAAEFMEDDRQVLTTGQAILNKEDTLPDGQGGVRWILGSKLPLQDDEGRIIGLVGFAQDITERKQAEQERLEFQRRMLEGQKLESLGLMAGSIAHDFNNLLMGVLGNLELALMDLPPNALARESIERAMQAGRRAADLTRQMLAYSGRGRFVAQHVNLGELVEESLEMLRAIVPRGVSFVLEINKDIPLIEADPGQVQQVMVNLISNAAEAIGEQEGLVRLATGACSCDEAYLSQSRLPKKPPPGEYVYLEVSDNGCGMDASTLERMFDPFFSTKMLGRGLGMAAVYGIVQGHGGAIMVQSAVGEGTTVRVLFPALVERAPAEPPLQEAVAPPRTGYTVLVVDDEPMVLRVAQRILQRFGYRALMAEGGEQALEILRAHREEIDAVLLDLTMPRMDGITVFERIRTLAPDLPVILSSGYNEQEIAQRYGGKGLTEFIQKPYSLERLAGVLERALNRKAPQERPSGRA